MLAAPAIRGGPALRAASLLAGLFLFAAGIVLLLESELGLSPWDVLNQGLSERSALTFGTANVAVAPVVLGAARLLGARIGPGTVANAVLIGLLVDGLLQLDAVTRLSEAPPAARAAMLAGGILVIGVGTLAFVLGIGPAIELAFRLLDRSPLAEGEVASAA